MSLVPPGTDGAVEVVVTSLELTAIDDIIAARPVEGATVVTDHPDPACLSERYYREVGADWFWVDRADWSPQQWSEWVGRPGHQLLELREYGEPAGYAELDPQADGSVELAYFGLLPGFIGRGLGGWLLEQALRAAMAVPGASRVWVHTCSLDGPTALANYRARGLREFATTLEWRDTRVQGQ